MRPSILIIGPPNSGTSILARMYQALGWNYVPDHETSRKFMESSWLLAIAKHIKQNTATPKECGRMFAEAYCKLERPVVMKDHRLSWTLGPLAPRILKVDPTIRLVLNSKNIVLVRESTRRRRGRTYWWHKRPEQWAAAARREYDRWEGDKLLVRHGHIQRAVANGDEAAFLAELEVPDADHDAAVRAMALYDPTRDEPGNPRQGSDGWRSDHADSR